jgi:hypothetical protein
MWRDICYVETKLLIPSSILKLLPLKHAARTSPWSVLTTAVERHMPSRIFPEASPSPLLLLPHHCPETPREYLMKHSPVDLTNSPSITTSTNILRSRFASKRHVTSSQHKATPPTTRSSQPASQTGTPIFHAKKLRTLRL